MSTERSWRLNTENCVNPRPNCGGCLKIRGIEHGENHEQAREPKLNMGDTEDILIVKSTNSQGENPTYTENN